MVAQVAAVAGAHAGHATANRRPGFDGVAPGGD
jgi:hypothetical protein